MMKVLEKMMKSVETDMICGIKHVFAVTSYEFNAFLMNY